ncbi:hypothetical protein I9W82_003351 [Candida metapsilosis]|uniref:RING-type E3 ubiquitin transferase n=1 Tax=Candida metapsilosis TaxID=273372 RepID=A0A8H7ZI76_9ASCO|nr:hypothetical protein I9W82_003351 [Candida metapsilosis]
MVDIEHTCRICRMEGTPSEPLYHPCKCRGSIKYIHQDCLMEWLKHSNQSSEKCDICNTPYKFKVIYDPNMPKIIPFSLVWNKFVQVAYTTFIKTVSIFLYVVCIIIQVPIFWKFCGRVYTWAIDGKLPVNNPNFVDALYFGNLDISEAIQNSTPSQIALLKARKFLSHTYFSGVRYILVGIIIHIALFVEREWVVRDEGYLKLLHRKIGKEPKAQLVDMLQNALDVLRRQENQNEREDVVQEANLNRAIESLQNRGEQLNRRYEEDLRRAINRGEIFNGDMQQNGDMPRRDDDHDDDVEVIHEDDGNVILEDGINHEPPQEAHRVVINDGPDSDEEEEEEDPGVRQALEDDFDQMEQGEEGNNNGGAIGEIMEVFGIILNIKTPLFLMVLCDSIITAYLFLIYVVPYILGDVLVFVVGAAISYISAYIPEHRSITTIETGYEYVDLSIVKISKYVIEPCENTFKDLVFPSDGQYSLSHRVLVLTFGYAIICVAIYNTMKGLTSGPKPILGSSRRVYKILFEMSSTAKVFVIFAIEIFFFPVYCGWLLDFCVAPLFLDKFTQSTESGTIFFFLFTSSDSWTQVPYIRTSLYWASGTLYMLFFALFVGMVRNVILRPGVLYFIRSPDDPNARLIHDALVKPLRLQLSRIYLSAQVYTGFILVGIGGVTWGSRYLVSPSHGKYNVMLPIELSLTPSGLIFMIPLGLSSGFVRHMLPLVTKYVRMYWTKAFEICVHRLRLSHFVLGKPIPHERGHVVYRDWKHQLSGTAIPDYTNPVTYRQAQEIFATNSEIHACFVPDGYYVRAPDNDTVSRKFIKKLFVPVTKDDKLLREVNENDMKSTGYETPSSEEEEINSDNAYCIVYRPPHFKLRCFTLIFMLWVFSVLLILSVIILALVLGRPLAVAQSVVFANTLSMFSLGDVNWKLADLASLTYGLLIEFNILKFVDMYIEEKKQQGGGNEVGDDAQPRPGVGFFLDNFRDFIGGVFGGDNGANQQNRVSAIGKVCCYSLGCTFWIYWIASVHILCIDLPLQVWFKTSITKMEPFPTFIHFLASWLTVLPAMMYMVKSPARELTLRETIKSVGAGYLMMNYILIGVPGVCFTTWKIGKDEQPGKGVPPVEGISFESRYFPQAWVASFLVFAVYRSLNTAVKVYEYIGQQIKTEKYVKGRAIVNDDEDVNEGERI